MDNSYSRISSLQEKGKRDSIANNENLTSCEREVISLMREAVNRNKGRATFIVEFVGTSWHILEAKPPVYIKL